MFELRLPTRHPGQIFGYSSTREIHICVDGIRQTPIHTCAQCAHAFQLNALALMLNGEWMLMPARGTIADEHKMFAVLKQFIQDVMIHVMLERFL